MNRQGKGSTNGAKGFGCLPILATFVLICGMVLLLMGDQRGCSAAKDPKVARKTALQQQVGKALGATKQAESALDNNNFGAAKASIRKAQQGLSNALYQLKSPEAGQN